MNVRMANTTDQTSTSSTVRISTAVGRAGSSEVIQTPIIHRSARGAGVLSDENVEKAVYAHIRAVRALGRDTVNTLEISKALSVSLALVERAVAKLQSKGIRVAK